MNRKIAGLIAVVTVICASIAVFLAISAVTPAQHTAQAFDFTVTGTNSCLRFLESNVSLCYVPFRVGANQNWQLTIDCTQMPGGSSGWTELYIYKGYWDNGINYKCTAADIYPILTRVHDANEQIQGNNAFTEIFNGTSTSQSYTVFFVFPNGGPATFHITYAQVE
jgi:hypothetical protein